ncbi:hypothetical protein Goari_012931, partial [Gossypium aridum]|nr:hypothetical protein [Gossypium aridum]
MDRLDISWKRGIKQLSVKSDCLVAVNMLNGQTEEIERSMTANSMVALGRNVLLDLRIYDVRPNRI